MSRFRIDWRAKDERLIALYKASEGRNRIAEILGIGPGAVAGRIRKLGLTREP